MDKIKSKENIGENACTKRIHRNKQSKTLINKDNNEILSLHNERQYENNISDEEKDFEQALKKAIDFKKEANNRIVENHSNIKCIDLLHHKRHSMRENINRNLDEDTTNIYKKIINESKKKSLQESNHNNINLNAYYLKTVTSTKDKVTKIISIIDNKKLLDIKIPSNLLYLFEMFLKLDKALNHYLSQYKIPSLELLSEFYTKSTNKTFEISHFNQLLFIFPGSFKIIWVESSANEELIFRNAKIILSRPSDLGNINYLELVDNDNIKLKDFQKLYMELPDSNYNTVVLSKNELEFRKNLFILHLNSYLRTINLAKYDEDILETDSFNKNFENEFSSNEIPSFNLITPKVIKFTSKDFLNQNNIFKHAVEYIQNKEETKENKVNSLILNKSISNQIEAHKIKDNILKFAKEINKHETEQNNLLSVFHLIRNYFKVSKVSTIQLAKIKEKINSNIKHLNYSQIDFYINILKETFSEIIKIFSHSELDEIMRFEENHDIALMEKKIKEYAETLK